MSDQTDDDDTQQTIEGPWPVGRHQVRLEVPDSFALRHELVAAAADNPARAFAACLGACWKGAGRPKASYTASKYDPLVYGGAVIDELAGRGATMREIMAAGAAAFKLMAPTIVSEREVADREGFSGGEGVSTS